MANLASSEAIDIDWLHGKVTESLKAFTSQNQEGERLAALQAAQDLVNALRKPQDAIYHLAYSVTCSVISKTRMELTSIANPSHVRAHCRGLGDFYHLG